MLGIPAFAANVTWFLPGTILSIVIGFVLRHRVGQLLGGSDALGWAFVVAVGLIAAATLTPLREGAIEGRAAALGCDFSRVGFVSLREILRADDSLRNIVLFVPLGLVTAFVPGWRRKATLLAIAGLAPIAIEASQLLVTPLHRACQSADVFDNVTGLFLGFAIGSILAATLVALRRDEGPVG